MDLIDILGWLVVGLIVGAVARLLMPGRDPMGCLMTALLGIAGAVVGGFVSRMFFGPAESEGYVRPGFLISLLGAILLLFLYRLMRGRRA